jgi:hypothetical protein
MTMTLIETVTVGSGGAQSITFASIPQDAKDIKIAFSLRSKNTDGGLRHYFNGDTGNRSTIQLVGYDGSTSSNPQNQLQATNRSDSTANTFSSGQTYVSNYASSSAKSWSVDSATESNGGTNTARLTIAAAKWNSTAAITAMTLHCDGQFAEHSTASLYLIS